MLSFSSHSDRVVVDKVIMGGIEFAVDMNTMQPVYRVWTNPTLFQDECHFLAYVTIESLILCGEDVLLQYGDRFVPSDKSTIIDKRLIHKGVKIDTSDIIKTF